MQSIAPAVRMMAITNPKTSTKRSPPPYTPNLTHENAYWKPKMNGIFEILNSAIHEPPESASITLEAQAAANCSTIVLLEGFLKGMIDHPTRRSDFFKMKIHHLLSTFMRTDQLTNEHLVLAEELYEEVLEEYPSKDEADIKNMGELIRASREELGSVENRRKAFDQEKMAFDGAYAAE